MREDYCFGVKKEEFNFIGDFETPDLGKVGRAFIIDMLVAEEGVGILTGEEAIGVEPPDESIFLGFLAWKKVSSIV